MYVNNGYMNDGSLMKFIPRKEPTVAAGFEIVVPRACLEVVANRKSETQPGNETSQ
jgi:hypothetical protein